MSAEIYAFVQAQTGTQLAQPINTQSQEENISQPGLFESIMTELENSEQEIITEDFLTAQEPQILSENMNFNGNNNLSVINFLSEINAQDETQGPHIFPEIPEQEADDVIIWENEEPQEKNNLVSEIVGRVKNFIEKNFDVDFEDVEQAISDFLNSEEFSQLSETEKEKISDEIINVVKNLDASAKEKISKVIAPIVEKFSFETPKELPELETQNETSQDTDDTEESPELSQDAANLAGLAQVQTNTPQVSQSDNTNNHDNTQTEKPAHHAPITRESSREISQTITAKPESDSETKPETPKTDTANFERVLDDETTPRENSSGNFGQQRRENNNEGENFSGARENFSDNRNASRSRTNDTRRANTNDDRAASTNRTNSHTSFQNFFEGVLTQRRTAAQTSSTPLNLRMSYNFSQSQTLRTGIVNVVRFIRADGLQRANIIVDPPALGRISVELTAGTSGVEASIKVASEQIRQLVQDQLADLRMNLSQQGVQVTEFTVDVQQDFSGSQQGSQDNNQQQRQAARIFEDEDESESENFRIDLEDGLLYWVA